MADMDGKLPTHAATTRRIAIIGGGPGGICMGIKLKAAGYDDFVIFEKADGIGGTWHRNRYPGLECDVQSEVYSFSFYPNPDWSCSYAPQPEILGYMERCAAEHGLLPHIRLSTAVTGADWDEEASVWHLALSTGERAEYDVVVGAVGMFGELKWPEVPGLDRFEGVIVHGGQWRADIDLEGKQVAVVGTAACGVQLIPKIADRVGALQVYQRSPHWVLPKKIQVYDDAERARRRADPTILAETRSGAFDVFSDMSKWALFEDTTKMEAWCRDNIAIVKDPELRRKLTPLTGWGCTRPLSSSTYYDSFNRDNVELIIGSVTGFTERGVIDAEGRERPADVVICATGYDVERFVSVVPISGRDGVKMNDAWRDGAQAYLGITTAGFPNLFMLYGPNTNNGSILYMIECQADYVVRHLRRMDAEDIGWIDVRPEAMDAYNVELMADLGRVKIWQGGCHNYYSNAAGRIVTQYPHSMVAYREATEAEDWQAFEIAQSIKRLSETAAE